MRRVPVSSLPVRTQLPETRFARWLASDSSGAAHREPTHPWYQVLWLTGVDYFSTLGYQPGIALLAAGALSPVATFLLVLVTLFGALPTYAQVARRSYAGQGSIAMLERLLPGWIGKTTVLTLLGFAATDFVITVTLSAADAAKHAVENPLLHPLLGNAQLPLTLLLIALLTVVFLKGFREAIGLAMVVGIPYLALNLVVVVRCFIEVANHPELISGWNTDLAAHGDWTALLIAAGLTFPRLALGLSGFETGVTVMPLIGGSRNASHGGVPKARIRDARKLLTTAAVLMSFYLLTSSFLTTVLIPPQDYAEGGPAAGRAIAHLAHEYLGHAFGTIYDFSTMAILWFAGASATAGLLHLVPRYLPRFGMAPAWVAHMRPLVLIFLGIEILVTFAFGADVEAQAGAYATGVLVLILSAAVAVTLSFLQESRASRRARFPCLAAAGGFSVVSVLFAYTLVENVITRPDGLIIASMFIAAVLLLSAASRMARSLELRVQDIVFDDEESERLWPEIAGRRVNLVPLATWSEKGRLRKRDEIRKYYCVSGPIAFVHAHLIDDRSEFEARLRLRIRREDGDYHVEVFGAVAIANAIASVSEMIDPISIFLSLSRLNLMEQAFRYLIWGEGEVGVIVYAILVRYWEWTVEEDVRPLIFLMSE
jgi:hypothetical protein